MQSWWQMGANHGAAQQGPRPRLHATHSNEAPQILRQVPVVIPITKGSQGHCNSKPGSLQLQAADPSPRPSLGLRIGIFETKGSSSDVFPEPLAMAQGNKPHDKGSSLHASPSVAQG